MTTITPYQLAVQFSNILKEWLTIAKLTEVNERNKQYKTNNADCCATHEFCDPNQAMIDAFTQLTGREIDVQSDSDLSLTNKAWAMAKESNFYVGYNVSNTAL